MIERGTEATIGEPLYAKVPTPGRPFSDEPAIEGPTSRKAQARTKLTVFIWLSPGLAAGALRRLVAT